MPAAFTSTITGLPRTCMICISRVSSGVLPGIGWLPILIDIDTPLDISIAFERTSSIWPYSVREIFIINPEENPSIMIERIAR